MQTIATNENQIPEVDRDNEVPNNADSNVRTPTTVEEDAGYGTGQTSGPDSNADGLISNPPLLRLEPGVHEIDPKRLHPHPLNQTVYGDEAPDEAFLDSVRSYGILTELQITADGVVLSGHRRLQAARALGLQTVPVNVVDAGDDISQQERILEANRNRHKSNEQRIREFSAYKGIEAEKAKQRKGGNPQLVENFTPVESPGKARDIAADKVGWSGVTAEKGEKVILLIDRDGKSAKASDRTKELRDILNKRSIDAAYKRAQDLGLIKSEKSARTPKNKCESKGDGQSHVGAGGDNPATEPSANAADRHPHPHGGAYGASAPKSPAHEQVTQPDAHAAPESEAMEAAGQPAPATKGEILREQALQDAQVNGEAIAKPEAPALAVDTEQSAPSSLPQGQHAPPEQPGTPVTGQGGVDDQTPLIAAVGTTGVEMSDEVEFELADGTERKVPWIHNDVLPTQKVEELLMKIKNDNEDPQTSYEYDMSALLEFQLGVISMAAVVVSVLGKKPSRPHRKRAYDVLTEIRDLMPSP